MSFICERKLRKGIETWKGRIKYSTDLGGYYEIYIESRSSIFVILGPYSDGYFACIPDFGAGCYIAGLSDYFYNKEKLVRVLGTIDGITVATALQSLAEVITI